VVSESAKIPQLCLIYIYKQITLNQVYTYPGINAVFCSSRRGCTDIAGANAAQWSSILVRTGVFDARQGQPKYQPTYEAEDVEEAVKWAITRELGRV